MRTIIQRTVNHISSSKEVSAHQDRYKRVLPIRQVLSSYLTDLRDSKSPGAN